MYFGPDEEEAVVKFLESTDEIERNQIFNEWLKAPLDKMIESIIRKYKLYRKGETFEDLHSDTLSFLITKADKFDKGAGRKAYSYYGTICKNYILGLLIKDEKVIKQLYSYEDIPNSELESKSELTYEMYDNNIDLPALIKELIVSIEAEVNNENLVNKKKITDNEKKVGYALIEILNNWQLTLSMMDGGSKYHKNSILESMRNYTNLSTKDIRLAMRRFKTLYNLIKMTGMEEGF